MDEQKINALLKSLDKRFQPDLPVDFGRNVWKEIQSREQHQSAYCRYWDDLLASFVSPRFVLASLCIALLTGTAGTAVASISPTPANASSALYLEVFDPSSSVPSLLGR